VLECRFDQVTLVIPGWMVMLARMKAAPGVVNFPASMVAHHVERDG
jgi:hypothetical protein